ncbi:MAG TPA: IS1634 family transposase, partial [Candidatus Rifleibacterium sp.]|nr:IS1634 family transposase [Candidatus Rifleibacterium sp.]
ISKRYKFDFDLNEVLSLLVYSRILYPSSKKSSLEAVSRLIEAPKSSLQHIYRSLEILAKESNFIQSQLYKESCKSVKRNTSVLYFDCTNYFFELEQASGIKQYGVSKEHRPNPIVQMGLFMDGDGIPLAFCINPGNDNEQKSLIPIETAIIRDFGLSRFIVCTDAGLASQSNRQFNNIGERAYVVTQSIKTMKGYLKNWALDPKDWQKAGSNEIINLDNIDEDSENQSLYYKSRPIKENGLEEQLVVTYSPKYKLYMRKVRERQIIRAEEKLKKPSSLKRKRANDPERFVTSLHCTNEGEVADKNVFVLNTDAIANEEKFDGFYAVCTNLEADPTEILKINKRRWEIEQSFRIMKHELRARPVFLSRDDRIQAHFMTCFISLLIYRILEHRMRSSLPQQEICGSAIVRTLKDMDFLDMQGEGYVPLYARSDITDALHDHFGFRTDTEIVTKAGMKKIIKKTKA